MFKYNSRSFKSRKKFEPITRQTYIDVMKFKLKHTVSVSETGIEIPPLLYWLAASPDGLITDETATPIFGIIYTNKICLKIRIFTSNCEMEWHT